MVFGRKDKQPTGKNNPKQTPREIAKDISDGKIKPRHIGPRSFEVIQQETISHIQNFQETFNSVELNMWENKLSMLTEELKQFTK